MKDEERTKLIEMRDWIRKELDSSVNFWLEKGMDKGQARRLHRYISTSIASRLPKNENTSANFSGLSRREA